MPEKNQTLSAETIKSEGYKMGKMKLGNNMQKRNIIDTSYGEDSQNVLDIQSSQQKETLCTFLISEVYAQYMHKKNYGYGAEYTPFIKSYSITLLHNDLIKTTIYFNKYSIEDKEIIFYDNQDNVLSSLANLKEENADTFLLKFKEKVLEGKAFGLAEYLQHKRLDKDDEEEYLKNIHPLIYFYAKKILAEWQIDKYAVRQ